MLLRSLGVTDVEAALRGLDKIDRLVGGVAQELAESGIGGDQASDAAADGANSHGRFGRGARAPGCAGCERRAARAGLGS